MLESAHQSRRPLAAITACLVAAALTGCADSGATENESTNAVASTTGGQTANSSLTSASSVTTTSSVTGASVTGTGTGTTSTSATSATSTSATSSVGVGGVTSSDGTQSTAGFGAMGGTTSTGGSTSGTGGATGSGGAGGGTGGTENPCPEVPPLSGGQEHCWMNGMDNLKGDAGGGYAFEVWAENIVSGCMTLRGVDATFGASWDTVEDFLARVGLDFDHTQTHSQIGTLAAEFAETKTDDGGLTYIGIYGWTLEPTIEYYILDDWGGTKPGGTASDGTPRTFKGTFDVDGATYDVYTKLRENKPSIVSGNDTFEQYFSIRQTARQCGRISISEHFSQWEAMGLPFGKLHEAKLLLEAQDNSGSIEFTTATVVVE